MTARSRRYRVALVAAALSVAGASLAAADGTAPQYPTAGGSTFATGLDGWKPAENAGCVVLGLPGDPFCSVTNERVDDHQGSLQTTFTSLADAAQAADGTGGFASPDFSVPADANIGRATLTLDRRLTSDGPLLDGAPVADLAVDLVDTTDPQAVRRTTLLDRSFDSTDTAWTGEDVALPDGTVLAGHTYHFETRAQLTSEQAQALEGSVAVAFDDVGLTTAPPPADGQDGATGAVGPAGDVGATGQTGTSGQTGQTGQSGQTGETGSTGAPGVPGPAGPVQVVAAPSSEPKINSAAARALLRVDRLVKAFTTGPFADQLRVRVFCKRKVATRCEGTLKVRTVGRINTALLGGRRLRKVTLGTGTYQMPRGRVGYAKVMLTPLGRALLLARGPFRVNALVTVLDQDGRQQVLRKRFRASIR